jgi:hypothetical protein
LIEFYKEKGLILDVGEKIIISNKCEHVRLSQPYVVPESLSRFAIRYITGNHISIVLDDQMTIENDTHSSAKHSMSIVVSGVIDIDITLEDEDELSSFECNATITAGIS